MCVGGRGGGRGAHKYAWQDRRSSASTATACDASCARKAGPTKETRASEKKDALQRPRAESGAVVRSERFVEPRDLWTLFTARGVKRRCSQLASNRAAYGPLSQRGHTPSCVDCGPPTC